MHAALDCVGYLMLFVFISTFKTGASQSEELHEFTMISPARGDWEINHLALFLFDSPQLDCCSPWYGDGGREREGERERERELVSLQTFEPGATRGLITRMLNIHWERRNHPRMAFFKFFTFRALNIILLYPQPDGAGIFTISCRLKQTAGIEHWWKHGGIGCSKHIFWICWSIFETRLQHSGCETRGPWGFWNLWWRNLVIFSWWWAPMAPAWINWAAPQMQWNLEDQTQPLEIHHL